MAAEDTAEAEVLPADEASCVGDVDEAAVDEETSRENLKSAEQEKEKEKDKGNEAYAKGDYEDAVKAWTRSLQSVKYILDKKLYEGEGKEDQQEEVFKMELRLCLNLAQGNLKLGEWNKAIEMADRALARDAKNGKALYRKACALEKLLSFSEAISVLEILLREDPNNAAARSMLQECRRHAERGERKAKKMSQKMFSVMGGERDPRRPPTQSEALFEMITTLPREALTVAWGLPQTLRDLRASLIAECKGRWRRLAQRARRKLEELGILRHRSRAGDQKLFTQGAKADGVGSTGETCEKED